MQVGDGHDGGGHDGARRGIAIGIGLGISPLRIVYCLVLVLMLVLMLVPEAVFVLLMTTFLKVKGVLAMSVLVPGQKE